MDKEQLIEALRALASLGDPEAAHGEADDLLVKYIDDPDVTAAFNAIEKWYA